MGGKTPLRSPRTRVAGEPTSPPDRRSELLVRVYECGFASVLADPDCTPAQAARLEPAVPRHLTPPNPPPDPNRLRRYRRPPRPLRPGLAVTSSSLRSLRRLRRTFPRIRRLPYRAVRHAARGCRLHRGRLNHLRAPPVTAKGQSFALEWRSGLRLSGCRRLDWAALSSDLGGGSFAQPGLRTSATGRIGGSFSSHPRIPHKVWRR